MAGKESLLRKIRVRILWNTVDRIQALWLNALGAVMTALVSWCIGYFHHINPWVCVIVGAIAVSVVWAPIVFFWKKIQGRPLHPIHEIHFAYLPVSPLENGWAKAYGNSVGATWFAAADAPIPGSMRMETEEGFAIQLTLEPNATLTGRLVYAAKYSDTTMIFISIRLVSADGTNPVEKWIKFELDSGEPRPTNKFEDREWTLPVKGKVISNG